MTSPESPPARSSPQNDDPPTGQASDEADRDNPFAGTLVLASREIRSAAVSPATAIVLGLFLIGSGLFFASVLVVSRLTTMRFWYVNMATLLLLFAPLLTMRTLAAEARSRSLNLLLASPITERSVVLGKYIGVLLVYAVILVLTGVYPVLLDVYGHVEIGQTATGYLGIFLYGAMALAIGLLASSITRNQIMAATIGFLVLLVLWVSQELAHLVSGPFARPLVLLSSVDHLEGFIRGHVQLEDLVYFTSMTALALFGATRMVERRRWS